MGFDNSWKVKTYSLTDQGTREYQQDAAKVVTYGTFTMAVICDGMGGMNHGEIASTQTIQNIFEDLDKAWPIYDIPEFLKKEALSMDHHVCMLKDVQNQSLNSGSTIVSAVVKDGDLYWMAVGDSRLYILRDKQLTPITKDHNYKNFLNEKLKKGEIDMDFYNSEIKKGESLTSYLGMGNISLIERNRRALHLESGDILLLCSDGLYKTLTEEQIEAVVNESGGNISIAGDRLIKTAHRFGKTGQDNTTVILLKVSADNR